MVRLVAEGSVSSCGIKEGSDASLEDRRLGGPSPMESEGKLGPRRRREGCGWQEQGIAAVLGLIGGVGNAVTLGAQVDAH